MSKYEKLGGFLLFEKLEEDKLSKSFLAGQIVNNEIKNINLVKKFDHSLSTLPDFILDLNQQFEILKSLSNPNIVRPSAVVQDKSEYAAVFEYMEGKTLRALLNKCAQDGYPFTADHALLIGSRLCTALEYLHSKKVNEERLVHGFVCPETILVSYDGEIKLEYMALAHALLKFPAGKDKFSHDYKNYMAPEMLSQGKLDRGVDVFGAGLVLYEMLTGDAFFAKGRNISVNDAVNAAQMHTNSGERTDLPEEVKKILYQALALDPTQRYASIGDMRKALDLLLFSSEFSPTTFNLAFFMHSVFREKIDEETKNLAGYKKIDVAAHVKEEPPPPPPAQKVEHPVGATTAKDVPVSAMATERPAAPSFSGPELFGEAQEPKEKSKMPLIIGGVLVVAVIGVLGVFMMGKKEPAQQQPPQAAAPAMTPEQEQKAAEEKAALEAQAKAATEEAKKKDDELKALQAKMDEILKAQQKAAASNPSAPAPAVDTAAIQKLQEQAKKLEEEKKAKEAEAAKLKEAAAAPAPPPPAATETPATTTPAGSDATKVASNTGAPPTTPPATGTEQQPASSGGDTQQPPPEAQPAAPQPAATKEGDLVELSSDVVKPEVLSKVNPSYPQVASAKKIEGTVILSLLISEKGDVSDVKLLRGAGGASGLNEAATAAVKKWKFRPAVKDGKRVKVWMTYPIVFKLQ